MIIDINTDYKLYLLNHTILGKTCYINTFLSKKERKDQVLYECAFGVGPSYYTDMKRLIAIK